MPLSLPADLGFPDGLAILSVFAFWFGYSAVLRLVARGSLNEQLGVVRLRWLRNATRRPAKPFDAILLGHIVNSIAFFGSATMIVLAGMVTTLASVRAVHDVVSALPFAATTSFDLFVVHVCVLTAVLALCFFSFTYALRKLIYVIALVGALPDVTARQGEVCDEASIEAMECAAATVLSEALKTFNFGIRGYYSFVAALGLFISPYLCLGLAVVVTGILFYRQVAEPTALAIRNYVEIASRER